MRRICLAGYFIIGSFANLCFASHNRDINADNITIGNLQPNRVSASTFTMQGSSILLTDLDSRIRSLEVSTSALRTSYNIVIGSLTANAVDIASNTADGLREAVRRLSGLVNSTTGYGSILYKTGVYQFNGATIPTGITVYALDKSSVIWQMADISSGIAVCYGNIDGVTFSFNGLTWNSVGVEASSQCKITNGRIIDGRNMSNTGGTAIFRTRFSTDTSVSAEFLDYRTNEVASNPIAPVQIINAQNVTYTLKLATPSVSTNGGVTFHVQNSSDVYIQDGLFDGVTGRFIYLINGNRRTHIRRNVFNIRGAHQNSGYINWDDSAATHSSGTFITDNLITYRYNSAGGNNGFLVTPGTGLTSGLVIRNNFFTATTLGGPTILTINSVAVRVIVINNIVMDSNGSNITFISDSGASTQMTGLLNFINGIHQ